MEELIATIARGLVDDKEAVSVTADPADEEGNVVYHLHVGAADGWVKCSEITAFFVKKCLTDGQGAAIIIRPRRRGRTSCALAHASRASLQKR